MKHLLYKLVEQIFDPEQFEEALKEELADSFDYNGLAALFIEEQAERIRDISLDIAKDSFKCFNDLKF